MANRGFIGLTEPPSETQQKVEIMNRPSRRAFLAATLPLALAACVTSPGTPAMPPIIDPSKPKHYPRPSADYVMMYGAMQDGGFVVPAVDLTRVNPAFLRREVYYDTLEPPGTIVVDTPARHLYLVLGDGRAIRYGIGVGREGFAWDGAAVVRRKAAWPSWHPPVEMQARDPKARKWAGGMPGGPDNPLGARALYLYQGNVDTLYRIHGTSEPWTIGSNVSSGCIRMINQDAIDLFNRVPVGTVVEVLGVAVPPVV